jgi:hypothetical protein
MTLEKKAVIFLNNSGNYNVYRSNISEHIQWAIVKLPLKTDGPNFATFYSDESLIDLAVSLGFDING